eukprot:523137_1
MSAFVKSFTNKMKLNRLFPAARTNGKYMLYSSGALLTAGFCISSLSHTHNNNNSVMAFMIEDELPDHFHLLDTLQDLAPKIDAETMLGGFLNEKKSQDLGEDTLFTADFVKKLFKESGIDDDAVIENLIHIMDWDNNDRLTQYEVAALFTLFNVGSDEERYKFLFKCLDLNESGSVQKDEFREILTSLLEAKYHLFGLENNRDPDEIYRDITVDEYHTMAKFHANHLVRKIFIYADQKRRGKLHWTEFHHWCLRGG